MAYFPLSLLRVAVRLFPRDNPCASRATTRSLRVKWLGAVAWLGPAWKGQARRLPLVGETPA